jgi:hypothetical protein
LATLHDPRSVIISRLTASRSEYILTEAFLYEMETNGQIRFGGRHKDVLGGDSTKAGGKP